MKEDKKREKNDRNMLLIFFMKKEKSHPHAKAPVIFFGLPMLELRCHQYTVPRVTPKGNPTITNNHFFYRL